MSNSVRRDGTRDLGIMQGRLSKLDGRPLQSFPIDSWELEFDVASSIGFSSIEWLIDLPTLFTNPLWSQHEEIVRCCTNTNVAIDTLCFDALMHMPWVEGASLLRSATFTELVQRTRDLGARTICVPLLGEASIVRNGLSREVLEVLDSLTERGEHSDIHIALETDLPTTELMELLAQYQSDHLGVALDVGNLYEHNIDALDQYRMLDHHIMLVHLKDRDTMCQPVRIGEGASQVLALYEAILSDEGSSPITLEVFRGEEPEKDIREQMFLCRAVERRLNHAGEQSPDG